METTRLVRVPQFATQWDVTARNPKTSFTGGRRRLYPAFTLIELLVVIAIIAVLMAILMPALKRAKMQGQAAVCRANLHQWAIMFNMYTNDYDGHFMPGLVSQYWNGRFTWIHTLRPYYDQGKEEGRASGNYTTPPPITSSVKNIRLCPRANRTVTDGGHYPWSAWAMYERSDAANFSFIQNDYGSYGINWWVGDDGTDQNSGAYKGVNKWRTTGQRNSNNIPIFMDCGFMLARPLDTNPPPQYDGDFTWTQNSGMSRICHDRHNGGINMAFMDWSVRNVRLKRLWTLKWHRNFDTNIYNLMNWPDWIRRYD